MQIESLSKNFELSYSDFMKKSQGVYEEKYKNSRKKFKSWYKYRNRNQKALLKAS
jgi:hypothetical protein